MTPLTHKRGRLFHAREFQAAHPEEQVLTADARALRLPDGSFDLVVSFETLYLIPMDRSGDRGAAEG